MHYPDFETFKSLSKQGNLIPVYREILADLETPMSTLMKLHRRTYVFLLESVEGGEKWGRYTFLGTDPHTVFTIRGEKVHVSTREKTSEAYHYGDPIKYLKNLLGQYIPVPVNGLPRFYGGAVGFLGYDIVRYFEKLPPRAENDLRTDEAVFLITDTLIIFDNVKHTIKILSCAFTEGEDDLHTLYKKTTQKIDSLTEILITPPSRIHDHTPLSQEKLTPASNIAPDTFKRMVSTAKEYIVAGDVIQVVLSQRFCLENPIEPIHLYRALRYVNPSPYLFFLKLDSTYLIGSSPEVMVRLENGIVELRPIAGTRKRGKTEQEDRLLASELLQDPKERAEHVMLVDLGRNDVGRIAIPGSVQVTQLMVVERYSHVMHLVSTIQGHLLKNKDCFDVLKATFPAGTLTGAPKIRAMEIIDELEPVLRGPYGGAVGYFSYTGNMDLCITIRTILVKNGKAFIQVGAGIVADSDPDREYEETVNKARGMMHAIHLAASGFSLHRNFQEEETL